MVRNLLVGSCATTRATKNNRGENGANSAEGPGSQSRREWLTRRHIALKEARETHFWIRLLRGSNPKVYDDPLAALENESD